MLSTAAAPLSVPLVPTSTGCSRGRCRDVPLWSRLAPLRGVFWHVSACHRRQDDWLPRLRPRASGRARQARRRSARVFELAARDEPARLVARRQPAQNALGILDSLAKLSGKVYGARAACLGRDGELGGYHDFQLSDRAAGSGLARRAARRQAAPHPSNSVFCLASLAATASGGRRRPPRFASAAYAYDTRLDTRIGSPPASPAAGPRGAPLVGSVLSRLCSAA